MTTPARSQAERRSAEEHRPEGAPRGALLRRHGVLVAGLALIVVQLGLRAVLLRHVYFRQDDFEFIVRAAESPLDWDYLMRSNAGQIMPGGFALAWALARSSGYEWGPAAAVTLVLQAGAGLAMLYMLRVLFGARLAILAPLTVFLFTPMTLAAFAWWAAALNAVPLQIAIAMAVAAHVHYVRTGRFRHALAAVGWIAFGLAFFVKAGAIPVLLLAVTSAYLTEGRWGRALLRALGGHWRAWALYAGVLAGYTAIYLVRLRTAGMGPGAPAADDAGAFVLRWLGQTVPTVAAGGPGGWVAATTGDYAVARPSPMVVAVAWSVVIAIVGMSAWFRRRGWRAWFILFGWLVAADMVPVLLGRVSAWSEQIFGFETRYLADAAPVLALCLGLACIALVGETEPYRRHPPEDWTNAATIGVIGVMYVIASLWSTYGYLAATTADPVRAYIGNARAALARVPPGAVIYDRAVPSHVMWSLVPRYSRTAHLLGPVAPPEARRAMARRVPVEQPLVFDDQGRLGPAVVSGSRADLGAGRCWPRRGRSVTVPVPPPGPGSSWVVQLGYVSAGEGRIRVGYGDRTVDTSVRPGLAQVFVPIQGRGPDLVVTSLTPANGLCVGAVVAGIPVPRP